MDKAERVLLGQMSDFGRGYENFRGRGEEGWGSIDGSGTERSLWRGIIIESLSSNKTSRQSESAPGSGGVGY